MPALGATFACPSPCGPDEWLARPGTGGPGPIVAVPLVLTAAGHGK